MWCKNSFQTKPREPQSEHRSPNAERMKSQHLVSPRLFHARPFFIIFFFSHSSAWNSIRRFRKCYLFFKTCFSAGFFQYSHVELSEIFNTADIQKWNWIIPRFTIWFESITGIFAHLHWLFSFTDSDLLTIQILCKLRFPLIQANQRILVTFFYPFPCIALLVIQTACMSYYSN